MTLQATAADVRPIAGERPLYQVLEQQQAQVGGNLMGSDHTYVIPGAKAAPGKKCAPSWSALLHGLCTALAQRVCTQ